jgi:L-lactate dehydrogenase (cytochrome)
VSLSTFPTLYGRRTRTPTRVQEKRHVLPEVVAAVCDRVEVLMDGGIRRGSDVVKALSLGARAVLVGRAYAWGLGAAGGPGVARAIEILKSDLVRTMRLLGCASMRELNGSFVDVPSWWRR